MPKPDDHGIALLFDLGTRQPAAVAVSAILSVPLPHVSDDAPAIKLPWSAED